MSLLTEKRSDRKYEQMMQRVPTNQPRGGGTRKRRYKYTAQDCDCKYCTEHCGQSKCKSRECICFQERLEGGAVPYIEVVERALKEYRFSKKMLKRAESLMQDGRRDFFMSKTHAAYWQYYGFRKQNNCLSAVKYLLCAHPLLRDRALDFIQDTSITLRKVDVRNIGIDAYPIFKVAKAIYYGTEEIAESELLDREIVSDEKFFLIVNAYAMLKFGGQVFIDWGDKND